MITLILSTISLLVGVGCEHHKGVYTTPSGDEIQYYIDNTDHHASLLLDILNELPHDPMVNVTYDKDKGGIRFHILGNDHYESTEEEFEHEAELTNELMDTDLGKGLPGLSKFVFEEYKVYGHENEGMMLLHQLALFSHNFHDGAHSPIPVRRQKRNILSTVLGGAENGETATNMVEGVFPESVVQVCKSNLISSHGGCTVDLAVEGYNDNTCIVRDEDEYEDEEETPHKFTEEEISRGCYGLCGPWCSCWVQVCEDCCWHPGCFQHDTYCEKPDSLSCRFGKGVVYGTKGLHKC